MSARKRSRETQRGYSSPLGEDVAIPPAAPAPHDLATAPHDLSESRPSLPLARPPVESDLELEEISERGGPSLLGDTWCAVEVWTQNRVYGIDGAMVCRFVRDRRSHADQPEHPTLGARLVGGQVRDAGGRITHVAHPFPRRGMAAVFASGMGSRLRVSETSLVTRVVIRQRVVEVGPDVVTPPWEAIVGR